jgi:hypothetical protein
MALHKVSAHSRASAHGSFEVDAASLLQGAQICPAQGLRRNTDFELIFGELRDCQASPVDTDAVPKMAISEDFRAVADCQGRSAAAAGRFIQAFQRGDSWLVVSAASKFCII